MKTTTTHHCTRLLITVIALTIFLIGCGSTQSSSSVQASGSPTSSMVTMAATSTIAPEQLVTNGQYSDERFIDMMVPHHMMAVQMAQIVSQKGAHAELKQLAATIISSQNQEIQEMKNLKQRLYSTSSTPMTMNPSNMENTGMIMPDQLAAQNPFDQAFLDSMIPHHASAIEMASVALMRSSNADIKRIARSIVDAQSQEIGTMIQWRKQWYGN